MALLILAATVFIILAAELIMNLWIRSSLKAGLTGVNNPGAKVAITLNWMGIKDLWQGKARRVKIDARNCRISDLDYQRLILDNRGFSLDLPLLFKEKRLEITSIQRTRIAAAVSERALQDYLNLRHPGLGIGVKIRPGKLRLSGSVLLLGSRVPVELEGRLVHSAAKTIEFHPSGLAIARHSVSGEVLDFISNQLPVRFTIMENWPLEITGIHLSEGRLSISLKEWAADSPDSNRISNKISISDIPVHSENLKSMVGDDGMDQPLIFLSTCEFSGDMHGEALINAIRKKLPGAVFWGVGGPRMAAAGMEVFYDPLSRSTIGITEALKNIREMKRLLHRIVRQWDRRRPDLVLWLDSGGFNLPLAKEAKKRGIPVVCMFSPSAWAYAQGRAVKLAARVKLLLAVLPFEAGFYRKFGTEVTYIGHPLLDRVKCQIAPADYRARLELQPDEKLVALMPGSRRQEIERLLPPMLAAAQSLDRELKVRWVLPVAATIDQRWLDSFLANFQVPVEIITGGVYDLLAAADGAVIASGTATLEAAILNTPMIIIYRISPLSLLIYRLLESPEHKGKPAIVGLPNLIMNEKITPEFTQDDLTPENIAETLQQILTDKQLNAKIRHALAKVKDLIGPPGVMDRAAELIGKALK